MSGEITESVDLNDDEGGAAHNKDKVNTWTVPSIPLGPDGGMTLTRLDAKIQFTVKAERTKTNSELSGIYKFTPLSWQVVNLPRVSNLFKKTTDAAHSGDFFNSLEMAFETETLTNEYYCDDQTRICNHGFSFYMMENRQEPGASPEGGWEYKHRDERNDADTGFKYAPEQATYVIIKGRLEIKEGTTSKTADVKYTIHLGDFGTNGGLDKFSVERNNTYNYNIFIEGVDHIRVEVETGDEREPGAEGDILISTSEAITCDSHYSTHSITFYQNNIDAEHMNWWVQTPFNPDGADPKSISLSAIDYEWVEFRVNKDKMSGGKYTENAWTDYRPRTGDHADPDNPTMTLPELMQYLQDPSHFDSDGKVVVTAFVNEFYYETNPLTGQFEHNLWVKFVNQPMRKMCILSKVEASSDGKSHVIESSFTIQQHSIQSVYNINNPDLNSAWGVEYYVDAREKKSYTKYWKNEDYDSRDNTDANNGRRNSMVEWGLLNPSWQTASWSTYLNLDGDSDEALMKSTYAYVRHTCMSRNRDNDGDGLIDMDEVRWYLASSNQLIDLYLGSYGIDPSAALYQRTPVERADRHTGDTDAIWREHVLASNRIETENDQPANSNSAIRVVRAEEAMAGSWYSRSNNRNFLSARCVRNLGYDPDSHKDITYSDETVSADKLILIKQYINGQECPDEDWTHETTYKNVYFEIDCSRVNEKSIRYFTDTDLPKHDEHSEAACLYTRFRTTSINESTAITSTNARTMNETIDSGTNPYCPKGYRLPNIREIGILCYYLDANIGSGVARKYITDKGKGPYTIARTYYSFGMEGDNKMTSQWGWAIGTDGEFKALMATDNHKTTSTRCVKDIR